MTLDEARNIVAEAFAAGVESPGIDLSSKRRIIGCSVDDPVANAAYNRLRQARIEAPQMMGLALDEYFEAHPLEGELVTIPGEPETDGAERIARGGPMDAKGRSVDKNGNPLDFGRPIRPSMAQYLARPGDGVPHRLVSLVPPGQPREDFAGSTAHGHVTTWWRASFECSDGKVRGACIFNKSDVGDPWLRELAAADRATLLAAVTGGGVPRS